MKMDDISDYIIQITCLNQDSLYEFLKNKLLSIDPRDITHTVFFKKLYVILLSVLLIFGVILMTIVIFVILEGL